MIIIAINGLKNYTTRSIYLYTELQVQNLIREPVSAVGCNHMSNFDLIEELTSV